MRSRETHKKGLKGNYKRLIDFMNQIYFKTLLFQLAWFSWLFDASLLSFFVFWCGNPGCSLIQPHSWLAICA